MKEAAEKIYTFAEYQLDPARRLLLRDRQPVALSAKAFDLLVVLVTNSGRVVTKDELIERVWQDQFVEEANLTVQISALRKALGERKDAPLFIQTVPGRGYSFVADVQTGDAKSATALERTSTAPLIVEEEMVVEQKSVSQIVIEQEIDAGDGAAIYTLTPAPPTAPINQGLIRGGGEAATSRRVKYGFAAAVFAAGVAAVFGVYKFLNKEIVVRPFQQINVTQLTTKGRVGLTVLSPDGKFYAYALGERGEYKNSLWLGQTGGSNDVQLRPPDDNRISGLAFSPDSKTLYFALRGTETQHGGLFKMPVLGGVAEKLLDRVGNWFTLSPDGKQVAFFRASKEKDASALVIANLDGTREHELLTRPPDKNFASRGPAWSPDGSLLAVAAVSDSKKGSSEIFIVKVADGSTEQLTSLDWIRVSNLVWLRDGQGLIVVAMDKSENVNQLWQVDYPEGRAHRLTRDTDGYGSPLGISADGNSLIAL